MGLNKQALDRYITGNYGEDQYPNDELEEDRKEYEVKPAITRRVRILLEVEVRCSETWKEYHSEEEMSYHNLARTLRREIANDTAGHWESLIPIDQGALMEFELVSWS